MRDGSNKAAGAPNDDVLTLDEQALFESVFIEEQQADGERWNLSDDWVEQLLRRIEQARSVAGDLTDTRTVVDAHELMEIVDLTADPEPRRLPALALAGFALLAIVGAVFAVGGLRESGSEEIALIPLSQQVDPPQLTPLAVPEGTTQFLNAGEGITVAVVGAPPADESYLSVSTDLENWDNTEALPVVYPLVDVSTDTWYVVGAHADSGFDVGGQAADGFWFTEIAAFASDDQGASWTQIETTSPDESGVAHTEIVIADLSIAVVDDQLLVVHSQVPAINWTEVARDAGLVDDETNVIENWGVSPRYFAYGPETFEEIELNAADLGLSGDDFTRFLSLETRAQLSVGREAFDEVDVPAADVILAAVDSNGGRFVLSTYHEYSPAKSFESTDGLSWQESDEEVIDTVQFRDIDDRPPLRDFLILPERQGVGLDRALVERAGWRVRLGNDDDGLFAEQSTLGSDRFSGVPHPDVEAQLVGGFGTDFGAALLWQDERLLNLRTTSTVIDNGYTFTFFDGFRVTVTDPDGVVLSEARSLFSIADGQVLVERASDVFVVGEQGNVLATANVDDAAQDLLRHDQLVENPPARFVSWASGPDTWRFAELEGIESAIWNFTVVDGGMLASAVGDPTQALLIEWPEEFGE